jgi:hypothetical protein
MEHAAFSIAKALGKNAVSQLKSQPQALKRNVFSKP